MIHLTRRWAYRSRTAAEWLLGGLLALISYGVLVPDPPWDILLRILSILVIGFMVWGHRLGRPTTAALLARRSVLTIVVYLVTLLALMAAGQDWRRSTTIGLLVITAASWAIAAWIYSDLTSCSPSDGALAVWASVSFSGLRRLLGDLAQLPEPRSRWPNIRWPTSGIRRP
jgi:hypothetical protein